MDKINELKDKAYNIATCHTYNASTRTIAMIAYALLTIAEKLTTPNGSEVT